MDLLKARFSVRRAELEVKRNPILSAIDAKKNLLSLEEARKRLSQLESDIKSRQAQAQAEMAVFAANRNKSMIDVAREKQRIAQAKVLSPMTGLVAVKQNRSGFFMFGQQMPDIREGDTLSPGIPVADVLDLSELEVVAKVGELDRANLHEGQDVRITLDAVPEKQIHGKIKGMSGTASANVFSGDPAKKFDVVFGIDMKQLLTELGVKPAEVQRILQTAERNASKAPAVPAGRLGGGRACRWRWRPAARTGGGASSRRGRRLPGGPPGAMPRAPLAPRCADAAAGARWRPARRSARGGQAAQTRQRWRSRRSGGGGGRRVGARTRQRRRGGIHQGRRGQEQIFRRGSGERQAASASRRRPRSWMCCCVPACWPTWKSSWRRSRTRCTSRCRRFSRRTASRSFTCRQGQPASRRASSRSPSAASPPWCSPAA